MVAVSRRRQLYATVAQGRESCQVPTGGSPRFRLAGNVMSLNKKQKKQLDVEHKKLKQLQMQLAGAKNQLDDPQEVARIEQEIAAVNGRIEKLKQQ
jgi:hypothetical protein